MTRKDYVKIAAALADGRPAPHWDANKRAQWEVDRSRIADALAADNPLFNRERFYAASEAEVVNLPTDPGGEPFEEKPKHTIRGKSMDEAPERFRYGATHDMSCPACLADGSSFTASPRSETYWSS